MVSEKFFRSFVLLAISVITPFFCWILLKSLAHNSSSAHNPDPWIQSLVDQPQSFTKNAAAQTWFKIVSVNTDLFWQKDNEALVPLADIPELPDKVVFVVQATGPTAAKHFYNFLKSREAAKKALILSSSDGFLKDMQYYDPNLQMSCGQAYLVRFRMLDQLGLANLMKTNMSAVLLEETLFDSYTNEFIAAFKARRVPVFINPKEGSSVSTESANLLIQ
jgi:hypothetical protein